jgi:type IV pilus assembly protein PilO
MAFDLSQMNDLDINEIGSWPLPARIVLIALLSAGILLLGYWVDIQDQIQRLEQADKEEQQLRSTFSARQGRMIDLDQYEQRLDEIQKSYGDRLQQLPGKVDVANLLQDITRLGRNNGLTFLSFEPRPGKDNGLYSSMSIRLRVRGAYHDFGLFASALGSLPRIVTLHDITIVPADGGELEISATAKTYWYDGQGLGGAGKPAGGDKSKSNIMGPDLRGWRRG